MPRKKIEHKEPVLNNLIEINGVFYYDNGPRPEETALCIRKLWEGYKKGIIS